MKKIEAIIKSFKLAEIKEALEKENLQRISLFTYPALRTGPTKRFTREAPKRLTRTSRRSLYRLSTRSNLYRASMR
jgi:nitrogen regulatory protein PII